MMMSESVSPSSTACSPSPNFYQGRPLAQYTTSAAANAGVLGAGATDLVYAAAGLPVIAGTQYMIPPPAMMSKYAMPG